METPFDNRSAPRRRMPLIRVGCWIALLSAGVTTSPRILAVETPDGCEAARGLDVVISGDGMIHGVLAAADLSTSIAEIRVIMVGASGRSIETRPTPEGRFMVGPVIPGVWTLVAGNQVAIVRAWSKNAAPPIARSEIVIRVREVKEKGVVLRGQSPIGDFFGSNRFLLGATIAGAIAIPIAIHYGSSSDNPSGS